MLGGKYILKLEEFNVHFFHQARPGPQAWRLWQEALQPYHCHCQLLVPLAAWLWTGPQLRRKWEMYWDNKTQFGYVLVESYYRIIQTKAGINDWYESTPATYTTVLPNGVPILLRLTNSDKWHHHLSKGHHQPDNPQYALNYLLLGPIFDLAMTK